MFPRKSLFYAPWEFALETIVKISFIGANGIENTEFLRFLNDLHDVPLLSKHVKNRDNPLRDEFEAKVVSTSLEVAGVGNLDPRREWIENVYVMVEKKDPLRIGANIEEFIIVVRDALINFRDSHEERDLHIHKTR